MSQCDCEKCELDVFEDNKKCILHCEKDDWYTLNEKKEKQ